MSDAFRWSAHIVTDDPSASLSDALRTLESANPAPNAVIVVDNAPAGRERPGDVSPQVRWLRNLRPQTHGRCHNQAIELAFHATTDASVPETIALLLTPDVMIDTLALAKLRELFEADPHIACVGPIVCRAHVEGSLDGDHREFDRTDIIDTAGISVGLLGRKKPIARGWKMESLGDARAPFAPSPSCFAVRLSALRVMSPDGPWLRESGAWEDVALGLFRGLKATGYSLAVAKEAIAWRLAARG